MALAAIDQSVDITFSETPYPAILGSFEVLTCTKDIRFESDSDQNKFLPCGYNPAAQTIPGLAIPGSLGFSGLDHAAENRAMNYNGILCVARLVTSIDGSAVRTFYCNYYTPKITVMAPEGEEVGTVTAEGPFAYHETA